jgi:hypothetical protein
MASRLSLENYGEPPPYNARHRVIVPISGVHRGTLAALRYARMLSDDVTAVHVSMEPEDTEKAQRKWAKWGRGTRLVILDSPYRLFVEPLLSYVNEILASRQPNETITIVVPHFVAETKLHNALHMQTAELLAPRTARNPRRGDHRSPPIKSHRVFRSCRDEPPVPAAVALPPASSATAGVTITAIPRDPSLSHPTRLLI